MARAAAMPGRLRRPCTRANTAFALVWSAPNGYSLPLGPHQDAMPADTLTEAQVDSSQTDLDDLAHLAVRRAVLPARRLDIDDIQQRCCPVH